MQTVRLLFSNNAGLFSRLVRLATWSRWSHVAIIDGDTVIEATARRGVHRTPLATALAAAKESVVVHIAADDPAAVIAAAANELGTRYDYTAVIGLGLRRNWQDDDAWFCSELVAHCFDEAGSPLFRPDSVRRVTPQHLWMLAPVPTLTFFGSLEGS